MTEMEDEPWEWQAGDYGWDEERDEPYGQTIVVELPDSGDDDD